MQVTESVQHPDENQAADLTRLLYLDLLKQCLTRSLFPEGRRPAEMNPSLRGQPVAWAAYSVLNRVLKVFKLELSWSYEPKLRAEGRDWPQNGETMIGLTRLQNIQDCVTDILRKNVPGDFIETGVWRGGACIFMRALLKSYGDEDRTVWVADSFEGLPKPEERYPQDAGDDHWKYADVLAVSIEQVKKNFERYGLLDRQVKFLKGWFKDTLPAAPIRQIALLRLDGDMYSSTMDALENLYGKLSCGGYVIIDDYGAVPACKQAVDEFRFRNSIQATMRKIDASGIFWEKL
jgi:O-methyltransferase